MVTLLNFLAQILVHFSKTLEHQDHLVDLFSQCRLQELELVFGQTQNAQRDGRTDRREG